MRNSLRNRMLRLAGLLPAILAAGCGGYTVTFRVQDVINAPTDESSRKRLDVDIVCLSKKDIDRHPDLASGGMRSDAWFAARRGAPGAANINDINPKQILALRGKGPEYAKYSSDDKVLGDPISSVRDGGQKSIVFKIKPPADNAMVIFGRFHDGRGGDASVSPVLIKPLPSWNTKLTIDVGTQKLTYTPEK